MVVRLLPRHRDRRHDAHVRHRAVTADRHAGHGVAPRQTDSHGGGGAIGAVVCTPPYMLGRIGILLLGSHTFFALGVVLIVFGFTLQAGATGAVKAIKMSSKLMVGKAPADTVASV